MQSHRHTDTHIRQTDRPTHPSTQRRTSVSRRHATLDAVGKLGRAVAVTVVHGRGIGAARRGRDVVEADARRRHGAGRGRTRGRAPVAGRLRWLLLLLLLLCWRWSRLRRLLCLRRLWRLPCLCWLLPIPSVGARGCWRAARARRPWRRPCWRRRVGSRCDVMRRHGVRAVVAEGRPGRACDRACARLRPVWWAHVGHGVWVRGRGGGGRRGASAAGRLGQRRLGQGTLALDDAVPGDQGALLANVVHGLVGS